MRIGTACRISGETTESAKMRRSATAAASYPHRLRTRGRRVRASPGADRRLRRRAAKGASARGRDLRRARPSRERHRRLPGDVRRSRANRRALRDLALLHVLHGRARPASRLPGAERPHARVCEALGGEIDSLRPARPGRGADRGGRALPRPRSSGHQAPPRGAAFPPERGPPLAGLAGRFAGKAGVFFDTSVWSPVDLLSFFHQVSPEQVLYASDYPYGRQPSSLLIALRTGRLAEFDELQLRNMLAGNANRIAHGEPPLPPTAPKGSGTFTQPMALARIHQYLSMATPLLWTRQPDTIGVLGLALNACEDRDGRPEELERIRELLLTARELRRALPEVEEEDRTAASRATFGLIHLADILAVTSGA